jgi:hypothetical protein
VKVAREICGQLDRNARTVNAQLRLYQGIIVGGAKQSRVFDRLYRQYGAPPYKVRVRQAAAAARRINGLRLPLPNCTLRSRDPAAAAARCPREPVAPELPSDVPSDDGVVWSYRCSV